MARRDLSRHSPPCVVRAKHSQHLGLLGSRLVYSSPDFTTTARWRMLRPYARRAPNPLELRQTSASSLRAALPPDTTSTPQSARRCRTQSRRQSPSQSARVRESRAATLELSNDETIEPAVSAPTPPTPRPPRLPLPPPARPLQDRTRRRATTRAR